MTRFSLGQIVISANASERLNTAVNRPFANSNRTAGIRAIGPAVIRGGMDGSADRRPASQPLARGDTGWLRPPSAALVRAARSRRTGRLPSLRRGTLGAV